MKVTTAEFIKSATKPAHYPDYGWPEVAFAGRSNVGKSSLINRLINRKNLVRTSSTPGRTQLINFFLINEFLSLVDLPGYGYAKVPLKVRKAWGPMIQTFLEKRASLKAVVLLQDLRRPPRDQDLDFMAWLDQARVPLILVATKADKVKPSKKAKAIKAFMAQVPENVPEPILCSAVTGQGINRIWAEILDRAVATE